MTAANKKDGVYAEDINKFLDKVIKINFINQIYQARTPGTWDNILQLCRAVREMYEDDSTKKSLYSAYLSTLF
jgi:hypothetical protein